ncbi:MAG: hypothetical protein AB7W37_04400 [Syntrophobacteraceae bacterium]
MTNCHRTIWICFVLLLFPIGAAWSQDVQSIEEHLSVFVQGQSLYKPNDLAGSRDEALKNLFEQAVTQAIGSVWAPNKIAAEFGAIQNRVLKSPQQYVQNYQVLSELSEGDFYKIRAEVTVSMDALRNGLKDLNSSREEPSSKEAGTGGEGAETTGPDDAARDGSSPVVTILPTPESPGASNANLPVFKRKVLWAAAENIDGDWRLSVDDESAPGIFAASMLQESQNYDIALVLPEENSLHIEANGKASLKDAVSSAQAAGAQCVVTGSVSLENTVENQQMLKTDLRILNSVTMQEMGKIRMERPVGAFSPDERAMETAALTAPELDRILREAAQAKPHSTISIGDAQDLTLIIQSYQSLSNWEELERVLRENFKSLKVKGLELGPEEIRVHLEGVDAQLPSLLEGLHLRSGVQVHVKDYSQEKRALTVELASGGASS